MREDTIYTYILKLGKTGKTLLVKSLKTVAVQGFETSYLFYDLGKTLVRQVRHSPREHVLIGVRSLFRKRQLDISCPYASTLRLMYKLPL